MYWVFLCPGLGDVFGESISILNLKKETYAYYTKELAARRSSLYLRKMTLDPSCCQPSPISWYIPKYDPAKEDAKDLLFMLWW